MRVPDRSRVYTTFRSFKLNENPIRVLRLVITPVIRTLVNRGNVGWYFIALHERKQYNGEPENRRKEKGFHIRFELLVDFTPEVIQQELPQDWEPLIKNDIPNISGITVDAGSVGVDKLKNEEVEQAWKVMGEASEWVLNMLDSYKTGFEIPNRQFIQHIHFIMNLLQPQYMYLSDGEKIIPINGALLWGD